MSFVMLSGCELRTLAEYNRLLVKGRRFEDFKVLLRVTVVSSAVRFVRLEPK